MKYISLCPIGWLFHSLVTGIREEKFVDCNRIVSLSFVRIGHTTVRTLSLTDENLLTFQNQIVPKFNSEHRKSFFSYPNLYTATFMIQRIYNLSGDARHIIEYDLESDIKCSTAYLRNNFLWQSANYVGRYFPAVNVSYHRRVAVLWSKLLPRIKFLPLLQTHT
jgi:hypothetical protein